LLAFSTLMFWKCFNSFCFCWICLMRSKWIIYLFLELSNISFSVSLFSAILYNKVPSSFPWSF
jgi:hypothetical protein